jgi:hypothetical protein
MLDGIKRNPIIVGAYAATDGICPMLAAHRGGGRTSFIGFARAWDSFAFRASHSRRARRATERELLVLRAYLEASLLEDECPETDLAAAAAEHKALVARRAAEPPAQDPAARSSGRRSERIRRHEHRAGSQRADQARVRAGSQRRGFGVRRRAEPALRAHPSGSAPSPS